MQNTKIEWCDHTINLWIGCQKVHTGCKNCYAETMNNRFRKDLNLWGANSYRLIVKSAFKQLDKIQKHAEKNNRRETVFVGSMMDIFEDSKTLLKYRPQYVTTNTLRDNLFNSIQKNKYPNLIFLFLTKRPENIIDFIPTEWINDIPNNVWFGNSISNQETADKYVPLLKQTHIQNLFLSIEPQVGEIKNLDLKGIKWVIQGGESGPKKRPFNIDWAYQIKDICEKANVPYFLKQIDKVQPIPEDLQIRQFPVW